MAAPKPPPATPVRALRSPPEPGAIVLVIGGPVARGEIPGLCERVRMLLERSDADLVCDVAALVDSDVGTVDVLARLQLTARRLGRQVRLRHASCELQELLALVGLGDVVLLNAASRLESRGKAEQREPPLGLEEGIQPDDPAV